MAEVFEAAYAIALSEGREDYAKVTFPDCWPLSRGVNDLLILPPWA